MNYFLVIIIILLFLVCMNKEGYINYLDLSYEASEKNCPLTHAKNYQTVQETYQMIQPFCYTRNELFDMTRFIQTDIPMPTDPDFFKHI